MSTQLRAVRARGLAIAALLFVNACSAVATTAEANLAASSSLDGAWSTRASGLVAAITLRWTADSVTGDGTYRAFSNLLGCGGQTLPDSGTFRLLAKRSQSNISGYMKFSNGWTPPYTGTLQDSSRIDGAFMSVDRGTCPFPLIHGLVP